MRKIMIAVVMASMLSAVNAEPLPREVSCLAQTIYHEARGEPSRCQRLVGQVVLNRVRHSRYPDTICGVVFQRHQFSWTRKPHPIKERKAWDNSVSLAKELIASKQTSSRMIYFTQGKRFGPVVDKCGAHIFMSGENSSE